MDAVKFIEERRRMYKVTGKRSPTLAGWIPAEKVVKEVEEWSAAHPRKTRQDVFLEQYPNCMTDDDGVVGTCPRNVDKTYVCDLRRLGGCPPCRRDFWMQEVK